MKGMSEGKQDMGGRMKSESKVRGKWKENERKVRGKCEDGK